MTEKKYKLLVTSSGIKGLIEYTVSPDNSVTVYVDYDTFTVFSKEDLHKFRMDTDKYVSLICESLPIEMHYFCTLNPYSLHIKAKFKDAYARKAIIKKIIKA